MPSSSATAFTVSRKPSLSVYFKSYERFLLVQYASAYQHLQLEYAVIIYSYVIE